MRSSRSFRKERRVKVRRSIPHNELRYLSDPEVALIAAERSDAEQHLGHVICGRYLGSRDGRPNLCWKSRGHTGSHL
jgi:hypothetical protein